MRFIFIWNEYLRVEGSSTTGSKFLATKHARVHHSSSNTDWYCAPRSHVGSTAPHSKWPPLRSGTLGTVAITACQPNLTQLSRSLVLLWYSKQYITRRQSLNIEYICLANEKMDHEEEFLSNFFTLVSQLCLDKAKESVVIMFRLFLSKFKFSVP